MSLRGLPPDQEEPPPGRGRSALRYLPLIALLSASVVAAAIGLVVTRRWDAAAEAAQHRDPIPVTALPESCRPGVPQPAAHPWTGDAAAASQDVWKQHAADLAGPTVQGQDGWVFWNDLQAMNFSQAVGRRYLDDAELERWRDHFTTLRDKLAEQGVPFYVLVTPAKWDVYPEEMPAWTQPIKGPGPLDQLLAQPENLPIIDVRAQLRAAASGQAVYSKVNSHWTDLGGYLAWQQTADCISQTSTLHNLKAPPITGVSLTGPFNEFASYGVPAPASPDWTTPNYQNALAPVTVTTADGKTTTVPGNQPLDLSLLPASTQTPGASTSLSALVLRDSFGNALSVPMQQNFAKTWQVRHNFDYPDSITDVLPLVKEHRPDVVILQVAQRHLNFPPDHTD